MSTNWAGIYTALKVIDFFLTLVGIKNTGDELADIVEDGRSDLGDNLDYLLSDAISSFFGGLTGLFVGSLAAIIISEPTKGIPVIRGVSVFMTFLGFFITLISLAKFGEEL